MRLRARGIGLYTLSYILAMWFYCCYYYYHYYYYK